MLNASVLFAVLCFLALLLFFSGLPNLRTCDLPTGTAETVDLSKKRMLERVLILIVTLIYAFSAFWNLGNRQSPQSFILMEGKAVVLEISDPATEQVLALFPGIGIGTYLIEYSDDAEGWFPQEAFMQDHVAVLKWAFLPLSFDHAVRYIRIKCDSGNP